MKLAVNISCLFLITLLGIFVLSSCITGVRTGNETGIPSTVILEERTSVTKNDSTPNGKNEPTITATLATTGIYEITTAQAAVETYYELMGAQKYAEAYQLLSPLKPHLKTVDDFTLEQEFFLKSYDLQSIESYPA